VSLVAMKVGHVECLDTAFIMSALHCCDKVDYFHYSVLA